ncbi:DUF2066 domain-containing protein [Rheinheimera metallidurans]|uniref:DUF2066 domain-containing protein n=1 Tax=Rheinheimera metallidurans TaxID=2925781 RepID=UPI0030034C9C
MIDRIWRVLAAMGVVMSVAANAGQVADLYQANVAADSAQWQRDALLQVLVRVTGKADIATEPALASELKQASGYIKQYEAIRHAQGNQMKVLLDATKVNRLLQQNNIGIWGALRPDILVWFVQQDNGNRSFVRRSDDGLNAVMRQAFQQAGLPLISPLYDMDDLLNLSETDVWAGFWQSISKASARYNADVILSVTTDKVVQDNESLYRLSWQRQDDGRTYRDEVTAIDETSLMQRFAAVLAGQLAERYASVMTGQNSAEYVLQVQQLNSLADVVQVQKLLQQVVGISEVTVSRFDLGTVHYRLQSDVSAESLINALRFNPKLRIVLASNNMAESVAAVNAVSVPVLATFEYLRP